MVLVGGYLPQSQGNLLAGSYADLGFEALKISIYTIPTKNY
jgi:hypothetical protein